MPGQPQADHQLLKKAQQGEAEAFGLLYERHAAAIFRYLYAHLGSRMDAEDLTSDVFLRAWQALPNYHERGVPFLAYLLRIAHNALVDHYRRPHLSTISTPAGDENHISQAPGPAEALTSKTEQLELAASLSQLKDDYRTVLVLRFINLLSPEETAQVMQRSPGAVRVLQHRALHALRQIIPVKTNTNDEE